MVSQNTSSVMRTVTTMFTVLVKNIKQLILGLVIVVVGISLFFLYRVWFAYRDESAQRNLGVLIEKYDNALRDKSSDLDDVLKQFEQGYDKNSSSRFAPYFLAYQMDILAEQDKKDEALTKVNEVIARLGSVPLALLYKTTRALMKLDMADEAIQKEGKSELEALAFDKKNQYNDTALFYLGRYYWFCDEVALARETWQTLVNQNQDEKLAVSPWVNQAKHYLAVTIV